MNKYQYNDTGIRYGPGSCLEHTVASSNVPGRVLFLTLTITPPLTNSELSIWLTWICFSELGYSALQVRGLSLQCRFCWLLGSVVHHVSSMLGFLTCPCWYCSHTALRTDRNRRSRETRKAWPMRLQLHPLVPVPCGPQSSFVLWVLWPPFECQPTSHWVKFKQASFPYLILPNFDSGTLQSPLTLSHSLHCEQCLPMVLSKRGITSWACSECTRSGLAGHPVLLF